MTVKQLDMTTVMIQNVSAVQRKSNLPGNNAAITEPVPERKVRAPIQIPAPMSETGASGAENNTTIPIHMEMIPRVS